MTNDLAVSMAELEGESAELLPSRETLHCWKGGAPHGSSYTSISQVNQVGLVNLNNSPVLSGDNFNILGIQL
jgi:hypothetical protein